MNGNGFTFIWVDENGEELFRVGIIAPYEIDEEDIYQLEEHLLNKEAKYDVICKEIIKFAPNYKIVNRKVGYLVEYFQL